MRGILGVLLVGLLAGCGGIDEGDALQADSAGGEVKAMACSDCGWLYASCMRTASTLEAVAECEANRQLCEETFCPGAAAPESTVHAMWPPQEPEMCGWYVNVACSSEGARLNCMWAPYEPGFCYCNGSYWQCN